MVTWVNPMSSEYTIEYTHTMIGLVNVVADSPEDAMSKIKDRHAHGHLLWNAGIRTTLEVVDKIATDE